MSRACSVSASSTRTATGSGLAALLDAGLLGFGALDLAAGRQALVAQHAQHLDFGALTTTFAELEHLDVARAGHAVLVFGTLLDRFGAPEHQQLADVLDRGGVELVRQRLEDGFALGTVVGEDAHLDQAVGLEGGVGFLLDGGRQAVAADHHDRVEVMGLGTEFLAFGGGELDGRHLGIIPCKQLAGAGCVSGRHFMP